MPRKTSSPKRRSASAKSPYTNQLADEVRQAHAGIRNLASKIERENVTKGIPFAGSKTAAALAKAFEEPVAYNEKDLQEELENDTGDCLNKLAYYGVNSDPSADKTLFYNMQPVLTAPASGADKRPDAFKNSVAQLILDERAALMASVGAAMVVCKILHGTPSKSYYSDSGLEMKLVYVEDVIAHVHEQFGDVITLDQTSSAAFERMTRDQRRNHERGLVRDLLTKGEAAAPANKFYETKAKAMINVEADNVGKLWATKSQGKEDALYKAVYESTETVLAGSPRVEYSSNMKLAGMTKDKAKAIVAEVLALVAIHVMTYAITAALDFYFKLAFRAKQDAFNTDNNVVTHSVFAPGLLAALKMYGVSESDFDDEMAFQINTNGEVKELFKAAHNSYDLTAGNAVGAKTFKSEADTTPAWLIPKDEQLKLEQEFNRTRGTKKTLSGGAAIPGVATGNGDIAGKIAASAKGYYDFKNASRHLGATTGFGRRHKKRTSSKKKAAFGKRRRISSKKARKSSFGKSRKTTTSRRRRNSRRA